MEIRDQLQDIFEAVRLQRGLPETSAPLFPVKWRQILEDCNPYVRRSRSGYACAHHEYIKGL